MTRIIIKPSSHCKRTKIQIQTHYVVSYSWNVPLCHQFLWPKEFSYTYFPLCFNIIHFLYIYKVAVFIIPYLDCSRSLYMFLSNLAFAYFKSSYSHYNQASLKIISCINSPCMKLVPSSRMNICSFADFLQPNSYWNLIFK